MQVTRARHDARQRSVGRDTICLIYCDTLLASAPAPHASSRSLPANSPLARQKARIHRPTRALVIPARHQRSRTRRCRSACLAGRIFTILLISVTPLLFLPTTHSSPTLSSSVDAYKLATGPLLRDLLEITVTLRTPILYDGDDDDTCA